jgi:hypothetical protein
MLRKAALKKVIQISGEEKKTKNSFPETNFKNLFRDRTSNLKNYEEKADKPRLLIGLLKPGY